MSDYASPDSFGLGAAAVDQAVAKQLASFMPISVALPCFAAAAPTGWIILAGQPTPADAPDLAAFYGPTLPDMQGRTVFGQGTNPDVAAVLQDDGLAVATRSPRHNSSVNEQPHDHQLHSRDNTIQAGGTSTAPFDQTSPSQTWVTDPAVTGITVGPGGDRPVDEVPYKVCNWIAPYR